MKNLKKRIDKVEQQVAQEEKLTEQDVELILSCLPPEVAGAVLDGLFGADVDHLPPGRQGNHGKAIERLIRVLPPDVAKLLKSKLAL